MADNKADDKKEVELIEYVVGVKYDKYLYTGYWKDGKPHKYGQIFDDDKLIYDGEILDGKAHGYGTLYKYYSDIELSEYFKGQFFQGALHGEVVGYWLVTNKKYQEANYDMGIVHGVVTYYHTNGSMRAKGMKTYGRPTGEWTFYYLNSKLHGKITYVTDYIYKGVFYENDETIEGLFRLDMSYCDIYNYNMKNEALYATITNLASNVYEIFKCDQDYYLLYMKTDIECMIDNYEVVKPIIYETVITDECLCLPPRKYKMIVGSEWKPANVHEHYTPFTYWEATLSDNQID